MEKVKVIGGGLAGCEAAWYIANMGFKVELYEMRPVRSTPAHHTDKLAELVCSNSLRSNELTNAAGLLKEEMRLLGSLIIKKAEENSVPAGAALAVDREKFSSAVTSAIQEHPLIEVCRKEVDHIPEPPAIIATGPLTSDSLSKAISQLLGKEYLYFYDAAAPIITADSIDWNIAFWGSRYNKGDEDYVNLPMTEEEYMEFYNELINAEVHPLKEFEKPVFFEGCMPIEVMARRGPKTLLFGPLKPVGIIDPRTGKQPYAVVQLRKENREGTLFNIVGFQTSLKWPEQKRVFSKIPGLKDPEFVRYGFIHRNTFIMSPKFMQPWLELKTTSGLFFAGQITGVEGYIESAASGIVAGVNMVRRLKGLDPITFPLETVVGSLCHYITSADPKNFQPMKANFGILPPLEEKVKSKKERNHRLAQRSIKILREFIAVNKLMV
ncbi:methylenetetrahydrofolate--tRNA-(uracil(54)-C(5))-methyltransferase (FADH(2)-oxidizing) TrmFO [Thermosediminibacter oceani]|uniref:Methylenetetrahydrofolate--tRNA-(uracil-5-)-methyltransferase TrmFO n=1 Tax=Thermosediminibacter oceani (strain ATCC BAA-1034 / DSM 16646 / JW/IW-1228P) TaxID=555079 RepID=D9S370_THEOJ|nr:methylenetetrahydrofolate--tRNA-(uracil(54)-C(5))-methyltransferase (FADH(2)-oxidizing) TrmFO [Thermosediminibacter oceani]ADL07847.1 gid protein [Thermosediminibacter oceani DSM 16646]